MPHHANKITTWKLFMLSKIKSQFLQWSPEYTIVVKFTGGHTLLMGWPNTTALKFAHFG